MTGYEVSPDGLRERVRSLSRLAEQTAALVATASRLAERQPLLGTAPPAQDLSRRLKDAGSGLAGEVGAAEREVREFRQLLAEIESTYTETDAEQARKVGR
ncbi:hypothetical protein GCM10011609_55390 [Lentzea pudingi]|uniref:PE family protein n=1 Tax=Lentzea pudingi TaxID=1789439 RepID=A0ABQ2IHK3_9PSEU|nr:hypothetical protein [Lentzea pudingi]GGN08633.1 hypothetical protein GCM10011609_55390 [Lentzea pudingi]